MSNTKRILYFIFSILFALNVNANGLRQIGCEALGGVLDFEDCNEPNLHEYQLISQCISVYGHRYSHDGAERFFGGSLTEEAQEYADELTDQIVYSLAARNVYEANKCQRDFYRNLTDEGHPQGTRFRQAVGNIYEQVLPQIRSKIPSSNPNAIFQTTDDVVRMRGGDRNGTPRQQQLYARSFNIAKNDARHRPVLEMDTLIKNVPMTDNKEVRDLVARAAAGNWSKDRFMNEYMAIMETFEQSAQAAFSNVARNVRRTSNCQATNQVCFNVNINDRGASSFRQQLLDSGAVQNVLVTSGIHQQLDRGYLCRMRRNERGCIALAAVEVAGSIIVPYAAATMGLRAGLALARAGVSASRASLIGNAISRGLVFGTYAAEFALAADDVIQDCFNRHPNYLASKENQSCEPEKQFRERLVESSISSCISSAALGLAPVGLTAAADFLADSTRAIDEAVDSAKAMENARTSGAAGDLTNSSGDRIIVDAVDRDELDFALSAAESDVALQGLRVKGITGDTPLTPEQLANLTEAERLTLIENGLDIALSSDDAARILRVLRRAEGRDLRPREIREIRSSIELSMTPSQRADSAFITNTIARLERNNVFSVPRGSATPRGRAIGSVGDASRRSASTDNLIDDMKNIFEGPAASRFNRTSNLPELYNAETLEHLRTLFDSWPPNLRADALEILQSVRRPEQEQLYRRYLAMLANSHPQNNPTEVIARLNRLRRDPSLMGAEMQAIESRLVQIAEQMRGLPINDPRAVALGAERSSLILQRSLFDLGDEIKINNIFSADAYHAGLAAGRNAHSLEGSFSLDIEVVGDNVNVCRGSMATRSGAFSGIAGGFMTICREGGYIDSQTNSDVLAAPTDNNLDGFQARYSRYNRFGLEPGTNISIGRNGPVEYSNGVNSGTGGNGGSIEFFTSRWGRDAPGVDNLQASVRVVQCNRAPQTTCDSLFQAQESIRIDDLRSGNAEELLNSAQTRVDQIISQSLANPSANRQMRPGESMEQYLNRVAREDPELGSALNLRREIELKREQIRTNSRFDSETQQLVDNYNRAERAPQEVERFVVRSEGLSSSQLRTNFAELIDSHPIVEAYARNMRTEIPQALDAVRSASTSQERTDALMRLNNLRNEQQDLTLAANTLSYRMGKAIDNQTTLSPIERELLKQELNERIGLMIE